MRIAFSGWAGSAKTEAAKYIKSYYGGELVSFAHGIKYIDNYLFGTGKKNRDRLQKIGEFFRTVDEDVWVNRTLESIEFEEKVVIDDLRRYNEYTALNDAGFKFVRIVADEDIRIKRLTERDGMCDTSLMYNESESGCADIEMTEVDNNGTIDELYDKLDALMKEWGYEKA